MKTGGRLASSIAISVAMHGLLLALTFVRLDWLLPDLPDVEIEWAEVELIDPDMLQDPEVEEIPDPPEQPPAEEPPPEEPPPEQPPPEQPPPEQPPPEPTEVTEPEAPKPPEETPPPPKPRVFGADGTDVDSLGPESSKFTLMLNMRRIARLPFADQAVQIMAPMYDFQLLFHGAGFDPLTDFDYILLASANATRISETFVAVQTRLSKEEFRAGIDRGLAKDGQVAKWEEVNGMLLANPRPKDLAKRDWDPRVFVFLDDKRAVYIRPEYLQAVIDGPRKGKGSSKNFVAQVTRMRRYARSEPSAGMHFVAKNIGRAARGVSVDGERVELTPPTRIEGVIRASRSPVAAISVEFEDPADAETAQKLWDGPLKSFVTDFKASRAPIPGMGLFDPGALMRSMYNTTKTEVEDSTFRLRRRFNQTETETILGLLATVAMLQMDPDAEKMARMKAERETLRKIRAEGKLTPTQALETLEGKRSPKGSPDVDEPDNPDTPDTPDTGEPAEPAPPTPGPDPDAKKPGTPPGPSLPSVGD